MITRFSLRRTSRVAARFAVSAFCLTLTAVQAQNQFLSTTAHGSYYRLFAADSPWNSYPVNPVLGSYQVQKPVLHPNWIPSIDDGAYSLGIFMATASDPSVTIYGKAGQTGVLDPDTGSFRNITLPHWPANVTPSSGTDGHADIVDVDAGVIHSFYQLQKVSGKWTAKMYSWSPLDGQGFGDAAHWSQGVRSSGVPSAAGLIRKHEVDDGKWHYDHALAMTLPSQTLANGVSAPAYIFPATTADIDAVANTGAIPLGALMMLPASFNTASITNSKLRKIAETLKIYGAYVVDRNFDTAYTILVESSANFSLMPNGWDNKAVAELELIRAALRQVLRAESWNDGNRKPRSALVAAPDNILSMRGVWQYPLGGLAPGTFNTWQQAVVFPSTTTQITQVNYANLSSVSWSKPKPGARMRFTAETSGKATVRLLVKVNGVSAFDSNYLGNGSTVSFPWPTAAASAVSVQLYSQSGLNTVSSARGILSAE